MGTTSKPHHEEDQSRPDQEIHDITQLHGASPEYPFDEYPD
jgi:hypothetical protein